jgi:hypothetical protein
MITYHCTSDSLQKLNWQTVVKYNCNTVTHKNINMSILQIIGFFNWPNPSSHIMALWADHLENVRTSMSHNPMGLQGPLQRHLTVYSMVTKVTNKTMRKVAKAIHLVTYSVPSEFLLVSFGRFTAFFHTYTTCVKCGIQFLSISYFDLNSYIL